MLVGFDGERLESSLVQVPGADGVPVQMPAPHVCRREAVHEGVQIAVAVRPEDEVPVAGHHAVGEDAHRDAFERASNNPFDCVVVAGVFEDLRASVGAVEDVEEHVPGSAACGARHSAELDLSPFFQQACGQLTSAVSSKHKSSHGTRGIDSSPDCAEPSKR